MAPRDEHGRFVPDVPEQPKDVEDTPGAGEPVAEAEAPEEAPVVEEVPVAAEAVKVEQIAEEPVTLADVAAKATDLFRAIRRLGTRPIREQIGKIADTTIEVLDDLSGDRKKPKG